MEYTHTCLTCVANNMLPERYTFTCGCIYILMALTGLVNSDCSSSYTADYTLKSFRSPHKKRGEICTYHLQSSRPTIISNVYIRIYFPKFDTLPYHICMGTHIDVFDGLTEAFPVIGRFCDMNSSLIRSSKDKLTLVSWMSGPYFDFQILYSLKPFTKPYPIVLFKDNTVEAPLPPLLIAAIAIGVFLFFFISGCLVSKYCNPCKRTDERSRSRENRGNNSGVDNSADSPGYWTSLALRHQLVNSRSEHRRPEPRPTNNVDPVSEADQPPPYWTVCADGEQTRDKTHTDSPPSYTMATAHPY